MLESRRRTKACAAFVEHEKRTENDTCLLFMSICARLMLRERYARERRRARECLLYARCVYGAGAETIPYAHIHMMAAFMRTRAFDPRHEVQQVRQSVGREKISTRCAVPVRERV